MAFQDDLYTSETQRQSDKRSAANQAAHTTADIAHFQRVLVACQKWGFSPSGVLSVLHALGAR